MYINLFDSQNHPTKLGTTILPIFQVRKLRHREGTHVAQAHVAMQGNGRIYTVGVGCHVAGH